jgi:hypothetical protein
MPEMSSCGGLPDVGVKEVGRYGRIGVVGGTCNSDSYLE